MVMKAELLVTVKGQDSSVAVKAIEPVLAELLTYKAGSLIVKKQGAAIPLWILRELSAMRMLWELPTFFQA